MAINQDNIQVTQMNSGLNLSQPSLSIQPSQLTDCLNVEIRDGALRSRSGFVFVTDEAEETALLMPPTLFGLVHDRNLVTEGIAPFFRVIGLTSGRIIEAAKFDGTTWTSEIVPSTITSLNPLTTDYDYTVSFAQAIFDNGTGFPELSHMIACISPTNPYRVKSTVAADATNTINNPLIRHNGLQWVLHLCDFGSGGTEVAANKILTFFGRLVLFGVADSTSTNNSVEIRWSAQDDAADFTFGSSNVFVTDGGGAIVDAYHLRDQMICYKENSILTGTRLLASPFIRWQPQITDVGLMGPNMVGVYRDTHFFVGTNNIYAYLGGTELIPIGKPIWTQFLSDLRDGGADEFKLYRHRCFTSVHTDTAQIAFWIVTGSKSFPTKAYVYSVDDNAWTIWETPNDGTNQAEFRSYGVYKHDNTITDAELIPYYIDVAPSQDIISRYDFSTLNDYDPNDTSSTVDIAAHATTKDFALSLQDRNVWARANFEVRGRADNSDTLVSASYDGGQTFDDSSAFSINTAENEVISFEEGGGGSYKVRYKMSTDTTSVGNAFVWNSIEIIAQVKDALEDNL